jgi:hypothetical protein
VSKDFDSNMSLCASFNDQVITTTTTFFTKGMELELDRALESALR